MNGHRPERENWKARAMAIGGEEFAEELAGLWDSYNAAVTAAPRHSAGWAAAERKRGAIEEELADLEIQKFLPEAEAGDPEAGRVVARATRYLRGRGGLTGIFKRFDTAARQTLEGVWLHDRERRARGGRHKRAFNEALALAEVCRLLNSTLLENRATLYQRAAEVSEVPAFGRAGGERQAAPDTIRKMLAPQVRQLKVMTAAERLKLLPELLKIGERLHHALDSGRRDIGGKRPVAWAADQVRRLLPGLPSKRRAA